MNKKTNIIKPNNINQIHKLNFVNEFISITNNYISRLARKISKELPRFTRFFPARSFTALIKVFFLLLIIIFILYNFIPLPFSARWKYSLLKNDNIDNHLNLADEFLINNRFKEAETEYLIIISRQKNKKSNNIINERVKQIYDSIQKIDMLEKETTRWEKILNEKPNYRDAYLELAMLHFQLKRPLTAKEYLKTAIELDPNYYLSKELQKIIK